ncbi:hypothetical protein F5B20DRAFT_534418 [Whalleya microplaca]|nr:hypothetical protein F5B20DRAFT_534418 [Whalleya microplaca]
MIITLLSESAGWIHLVLIAIAHPSAQLSSVRRRLGMADGSFTGAYLPRNLSDCSSRSGIPSRDEEYQTGTIIFSWILQCTSHLTSMFSWHRYI